MIIKDYSGKEVEADVVYAIPTDTGNDYVRLSDEELRVYSLVTKQNLSEVRARAIMLNITD